MPIIKMLNFLIVMLFIILLLKLLLMRLNHHISLKKIIFVTMDSGIIYKSDLILDLFDNKVVPKNPDSFLNN